MEKKTTECHKHFNRVREAYRAQAGIIIGLAIWRYVKTKRAKKAADEERKRKAREAKAKKKNKYAPRGSVAQKKNLGLTVRDTP